MMEEITEMRKLSLRPKEEIEIKNVFATILASFKANKKLIDKVFLTEVGANFNLKQATEIFVPSANNSYGIVEKPFINNYGRVAENMTPYGIVGLKVDRKIMFKNYLEIIKVCLETRNSLIIQPNKMNAALDCIITIINDVLAQTVDFCKIVLTTNDIENEDIDLLLYIGNKEKFNTFKNEKIYIGVGRYELVVDSVIDENLIEHCKQAGVKIYNLDETTYDKLNAEGNNYCTAIMSSNKETIREFLTRTKSSFLLVNISPTMINDVNLFPEQLLKRKKTLIFEQHSFKI